MAFWLVLLVELLFEDWLELVLDWLVDDSSSDFLLLAKITPPTTSAATTTIATNIISLLLEPDSGSWSSIVSPYIIHAYLTVYPDFTEYELDGRYMLLGFVEHEHRYGTDCEY